MSSQSPSIRRRRCRTLVLAVCIVSLAAVPAIAWGQRPLAVRVQWGGGQPQAWTGRIAVIDDAAPLEPQSFTWQTLCTDPDAAACVHEEAAELRLHQPRPLQMDGVELVVADAGQRRLVVEVAPAQGGTPAGRVEVRLVDLLTQTIQLPLDGDGNRLTVRPAPGEMLRVAITAADTGEPVHVCRPGDRIRCTVDPWLPVRGDGAATVELRMRLREARRPGEIATEATTLVPRPATIAGAAGALRAVQFETIAFDVALPSTEAAYELEFEAAEQAGMRWSRSVASRTVQVVAVADAPAPRVDESNDWKVVYELDPGSPKLHERLRRLPGSLPSVPLPTMPLPSLTRPTFPRLPNVTLPAIPLPGVSLPSVSLPSVPVPDVSSLMPRLSGLLATGHSAVEPHVLGPMLRLPPADSLGGPTWEGVLVAGVRPGMPLAVEIDVPTDQEAALAALVLELDAAGAAVQTRHAGGFALRREFAAAEPRLDRHRFVFWPSSRNPLLLLANPSPRSAVTFGRVRVFAGPERLPVGPTVDGGGRRLHAFLAAPEFLEFGGDQRMERQAGRPMTDWHTHLAGIRNAVDSLLSQRAGGAIVTVHGRGAAAWPSPLTRFAPRWDCGAGESGLDAQPKDVLDVLCRVFGREGLTLVPALSCDAPLPAVEAVLAGGGAMTAGIACVGRDGLPRRTPAGATHYNILDPRVQQAVEELVAELAVRVQGQRAVDGIALVLSHDGWLHLPGVAWGLDDATFARFARDVGATLPAARAADRFAVRAGLVEGPLRERWLEWRAAEIAGFHARLAAVIARHDDRLSLSIVPTTLFSQGELAERFRPLLAATAPTFELAEIGLDPGRSTADRRVVFVTPWMHGGRGVGEQARLAAANRAPALLRAAAESARRGAVLVEQAGECVVQPAATQAGFGVAPPAPCRFLAVAVGSERERGLTEALLAADAERIYDTGMLSTATVSVPAGRAAFEALPAVPFDDDTAGGGHSPALIVRSHRQAEGTWLCVINPTAAPGRIVFVFDTAEPTAMAVAGRNRLPLRALEGRPHEMTIDIDAWGMRAVWLEGGARCQAVRLEPDPRVPTEVAARLGRLRERRATLESPVPLDVLDNPGFELGGGDPRGTAAGVTLSGWELVDGRRGALQPIEGGVGGGQAVAFAAGKGLATLRSNPFSRPASGRISVAAWLRIPPGAPQPPLRMAIEGVQDNREFYRFATLGGKGAARPLEHAWAQFVLPLDDLPEDRLESLRVRFDLLGEGTVEIDEVRVFDLAFSESQRSQLTRLLDGIDVRLQAGDVAGCTVDLDGHWPRYLETFVPAPPPVVTNAADDITGSAGQRRGDERAGSMGRIRRWRQ
jgi:hypothetical protein